MTPRPDVLAGLDDEQRAVAEALHGPVVVLAGAGTGKTRAITHRIAHGAATGQHDPRRTLAVTFTTRAAGEMRSRLRTLGVDGVQVRTFHAAALRQLRFFWPRLSGGDFPELLPSKARLVAESASRCKLPTDTATVRDLASDLEWAKVNFLTGAAVGERAAAANRTLAVDAAAFAQLQVAYEDAKAARGLLDFEDVLLVTAGALADRPDIADAVRAAYRWFTVDEYQDVNPLQHRLLGLWLGERDDVCVVGDANQTIYTFTGATPAYLTSFRTTYPDATEVRLVRCYRCTPQIVTLANAVIGRAAKADPATALVLRSQRPAGAEPTVEVFDDDVEEAAQVARRARQYLADGRPRTRHRRALPHQLPVGPAGGGVRRGGRAGRPARHRAVLRPTRGARGGDAPARGRARRARRTAARGGGAGRAEHRGLDAHAAAHGRAPCGSAGSPSLPWPRWRTRWPSRWATRCPPSSSSWTRAPSCSTPPWPTASRSRPSTLPRASSGAILFVVGCSDGLLPLQYADTPAQVEEERRLAYVAITRAADHLHLSWARARQPGGRQVRSVSPFLAEALAGRAGVGDALTGGVVKRGSGKARGERPRKGPARCRVCRKGLVTAPGAHPRPLPVVPGRPQRRAAGCAAGVATADLAREGRPRVRGVHRCDADRHRRAGAG